MDTNFYDLGGHQLLRSRPLFESQKLPGGGGRPEGVRNTQEANAFRVAEGKTMTPKSLGGVVPPDW